MTYYLLTKSPITLNLLSFIFFSLLSDCWVFQKASAQEYAQDPSLRELCRRNIAGIYLKNYDSMEQAKIMISYFKNNLKTLEANLKANDREIDKKTKELRKIIYDINLTNQLEDLEAKQKSLSASILESRTLLDTYQKQFVAAQEQTERFLKLISPLFQIKEIKGNGSGYKFMVDFKEVCPPYRYGCPLSASSAHKLKKMHSLDFELPTPCLRYADYLQK